MRIAIFTNQFPGRVNTFFARDVRALLDAGLDLEVFPFYPLDPGLWRYVPESLDATVFPRDKAHHVSLPKSIAALRPWPIRKSRIFLRDTLTIAASAAPFGLRSLAKTAYVFPKAWAWSSAHRNQYDHVLAYWGNYSATCAYVFHRLMDRSVPFSMFLHAGVDLYENQVFLREKLLYADNIIVVCDFNRDFLRGLYPEAYPQLAPKIIKHHPGVDLTRFAYTAEGRLSRRILAVGGLEKYKGFEHLLKAAQELGRRGIDYELEFIGDGSEGPNLRMMANELLPSGKVMFRGWLQPSDVRIAMGQATVFVHPSSGVGDAVPTVIKEAMAVGTPVVASKVAGIPELLDGGRCGILVPPSDSNAIADAVEGLFKDPELRQSLAVAAREYAEDKFDAQRNGARLARLLSSQGDRRDRDLSTAQQR